MINAILGILHKKAQQKSTGGKHESTQHKQNSNVRLFSDSEDNVYELVTTVPEVACVDNVAVVEDKCLSFHNVKQSPVWDTSGFVGDQLHETAWRGQRITVTCISEDSPREFMLCYLT